MFIGHARKVKSMKLQEISLSRNSDIDDNVRRSTSKVPFIIDRPQPNLDSLKGMRGKLLIWSSRKFSPVEDEIQTKTYSDLQIKCPTLLTDLNQTWIFVAHARKVITMEFQGISSSKSRDTD